MMMMMKMKMKKEEKEEEISSLKICRESQKRQD